MTFVSQLGVLRRYKKVALLLAGLLTAQLIIGGLVIYLGGLAQTNDYIQAISSRAREDITFVDHTWNTARYDSDPEIPGNYRIYVITKDGFVIDRWRPIPGYLDTSDFRQLLSYQKATTIHTITGQDWRMLSLPIRHNGNTVGVISVGRIISDVEPGVILVDQELRASAVELMEQLAIDDNALDVSQINVRSIPFTISFQVVDQYNRIQLKSDTANSIDRLPNYIDPSYIADNLNHSFTKFVQAANSSERYLVQSTALHDASGSPIGTIIVARTITPYLDLLNNYLIAGTITGALLLGTVIFIMKRFNGALLHVSDEPLQLLKDDEIREISFVKDECLLVINDQEIAVTYATNQYYMCLALFSRPSKKWETDELVEHFGIDHGVEAWRKLYDAMSSINKKCHMVMETNLIIASNKTYRINPALTSVVVKNNK